MRTILGLCVLLAAAETRAADRAELGGGAVAVVASGTLSVQAGGAAVWSEPLGGQGPSAGGEVAIHALKDGLQAVHARAAFGAVTREAVALWEPSARTARLIWIGTTSLAGDPGERLAEAVRFDDLTGDGIPEIAVGAVSERVRICGAQELPLLFRRVYDLAGRAFRPVLAKRPGLPALQDIPGGSLPAGARFEPLVRSLVPKAVSRAAGDRGDPLLLGPGVELGDGNPRTAWSPIPGNGAGELATFALAAEAYGLKRIGVRALPAGVRPDRFDRPKTLLLVSGPSAFRLVFPSDPLDEPEETIWFELPKPLPTTCLTLVVESTFAPSPKRLVTLAEVTALTEVDEPGGLARLVRDLDDPDRGNQAALLLERIGEPAVAAMVEAYETLGEPGKRRAVGALARSAPASAVPLLAEAALGADPVAAEDAQAGLLRQADAAVPVLAPVLDEQDAARFKAALGMLATLDSDAALAAVVSRAGKGDRERRGVLRDEMARAAARRGDQLLAAVERADAADDKEALLDLLRAGALLPELCDRLAPIAVRRFQASTSFADKHRLLGALASLGCAAPADVLLAATKDADHLLRAAAFEGLGACDAAARGAGSALVAALKDGALEVRLAALAALAASDQAAALGEAEVTALLSDPWPELRAGIASLAARLPAERAARILEKTAADPSARVREKALEAAVAAPGAAGERVIAERLAAPGETPELRAKAAEAAGRRCLASALPALFEVLRRGAEPLADPGDVGAAVVAAKAMGAIGGPEAKELLDKAKRRSNPATDKAIDAALKSLGQACGR